MTPKLSDLLAQHPAELAVWLRAWLRDGNAIRLDSEINWLGFAESAAARVADVRDGQTVLETMLWGHLAVMVREELAQAKSGGKMYGMMVRYNLIMRFGNHPGDPLCDSKIIVDWFFQTLQLSFEEASRQTEMWHREPAGRSYEFKVVIDQLRMLQSLNQEKKLAPTDGLQRWLKLVERVDGDSSINESHRLG
jgi:hypothetical protein